MKLCIQCRHAATNSSGLYCTALHEEIWNETVAETCELFEAEDQEDNESGVA